MRAREMRKTHKSLVENSERKKLIRRPDRRSENIIKLNVEEIECEDVV
jgi:hypothetical protein